jgi:poly [ADP-ribose] polymerase
VALSGKFDADGHSHASLETLIRSIGGTVSKSVTKATTHVVCTEDDYNSSTTKVVAAKAKDLPVVSIAWVTESENKKADASVYSWAASASNQDNGTNGVANGAGKKRGADAAAASDEEGQDSKPKSKKAKKQKSSASNDKETEGEEEEEEVAEGQFIKKKGAVIQLDEVCPLTTYEVYVDPDSGMIYDASLNQSNSNANANKFYRLQVCTVIASFHPRSLVFYYILMFDAFCSCRCWWSPKLEHTKHGHAGAV